MTKDEKEKTHVDAIIERYKDLMVEIPPADRQPGLSLLWPVPAQPAIDKGVRQAENWLADQIEGQLWTAFAFGRDSLPTPMQKTAFEVAFLTRLQQRLVAARRSGWPG
ncbi:LasR-specific antiactivator QslA, partial [Pseudomonas aeruginosa]